MAPPLGKSENIFWQDTLLKIGFQPIYFAQNAGNAVSETQNFKMGFETYIFSSKVLSKCRKCRFRDPNFKKFSVVTMASPSLKSWLRHCSLTIPMLETLDYTIRIGSTPTFFYFELYLYSAYAAHYVYFTLLYKIKWFIEFSATSKIDNLTWDFMISW